MQKDKRSLDSLIPLKTAIYFTLIYIPALLSCLKAAYVIEDPIRYLDAVNYLKGFWLIVGNNDLSSSRQVFGKSPEVVLPFFYYIISLIYVPERFQQIIIINSLLFWAFYILGVTRLVDRIYLKTDDSVIFLRNRRHYIKLILIYIVPLGVSAQLGRQALGFAILLFALSWIRIRRDFLRSMISLLVVLLTHVYSAVTWFFMYYLIRKNKYIVTVNLLSIILIIYVLQPIFVTNFHLHYQQFMIIPLSNVHLNISLMIAFFLSFELKKIRYLRLFPVLLFILFLAFAYQPLFIIKRIWFGMDFFVPLALVIFGFISFNLSKSSQIVLINKIKFLIPLLLCLRIFESITRF